MFDSTVPINAAPTPIKPIRNRCLPTAADHLTRQPPSSRKNCITLRLVVLWKNTFRAKMSAYNACTRTCRCTHAHVGTWHMHAPPRASDDRGAAVPRLPNATLRLLAGDYRRIALPSFLINYFGQKRIGEHYVWQKSRKTDRLNKYFRLKRIAAAQKNRRHAPPGRGPGPASAPLPGAGNGAQEPPAEALQLLQASQKASKTSPERID